MSLWKKDEGPERQKPLTKKEVVVATAFVENSGNISATARQTQVSRKTVTRIMEKAEVREAVVEEMKTKGVTLDKLAQVMADGLDATMPVVKWIYDEDTKHKRQVIKAAPDHKARLKYAELTFKLMKIDASGKQDEVKEEMIDVTDKELILIANSDGEIAELLKNKDKTGFVRGLIEDNISEEDSEG